MAALLDNDGPLDLYASIVAVGWTTVWYMGLCLGIEPVNEFLLRCFAWFGIFDAGITSVDDINTGIGALGGCSYALPCLAIYLPRFLGKETPAARQTRQEYGFWVWTGWVIFNIVPLMGLHDSPYSGSPANYVWLVNNIFIAYLHYRWAGKSALSKLKLA